MTIGQDVKLDDFGDYYDISFTNGDITTEDSFDASIITSLFVDRRADESEVLEPERRRGWIGSHDSEYKLGSKIWVYSQSKLTNITKNSILNAARDALIHFVDDGLAKDIDANATIENGSVNLSVVITRPNNKVDYLYYKLWSNTGK